VTPFGVAWPEIEIRHIERFLAQAGAEPLTWEAKADGERPLHPSTVRKAICAFANSDLGGYLILGAAEAEDGWRLVGLSRPPRDLGSWTSNIAREVRPTPAVDVRTWRRTNKRGPVAIVWIPPVSEPPAMTNDGIVYQRVSGSSIAVTDGRVLASLFSKGDAARSLAEQFAERALTNALQADGHRLDFTYATFGFAATGGRRTDRRCCSPRR
jgi:predicted HTH transcriptional regulator